MAGLLNFWLFLIFAAGIVLGFHFPHRPLLFIIFSLVSSVLIYFFYKRKNFFCSDICILLLFFFLGGLWVIPQAKRSQAIDTCLSLDGVFTLKTVSLPQERSTRNTFYAVVQPFNKKVYVMDYTRNLEYLYSYKVMGKLSRRNYQGRDFYTFWVKKGAEIEELPSPFWNRYTRKTIAYLLGVFESNLKPQGYRFLASILLGRREVLADEKQILTNAGAAHLLALSGLHLGFISLMLFFILRLFYLSFRTSLVISVLFLLVYTFLTGMAWSTLRAALMYFFFAAGFFLKRRVNLLNSLGLAGLCTLIVNPSALFEVGFQLSYLAVFALIVWFKIFPVKVFANRLLNYLQGLFFCSFSVTLFLTPLISYYFGRIYFLSVFYNLILIPFFALLLTIGFLLIVFSALGFIAQSIGSILSLGISWFVSLTGALGSFGLSYFEYRFSSYMVGMYYFLLVVGLISIPRLASRRSRGDLFKDKFRKG
ncbi:MAG: ComEC/Rec2 family competence protein [Candidatus Omnitrophota bacterium]